MISQLPVALYILCSEDIRSSLCVSTLNLVCNLRTLTYLLYLLLCGHTLTLPLPFATTTIKMESHKAMYKRCSAAAAAFTQAMVNLWQMKPNNIRQCPAQRNHIVNLRKLMEEEGVCKGEDLHAYIDIEDPLWGDCSKDKAIALLNDISNHNQVTGTGTVIMSVLPEDIPLRITTRLHCLHAYCSYLVDHWSEINEVKPPLDPPPKDCPFAEGLRKSATEILAQDNTCWIMTIKYICRWLSVPSWSCILTNYQLTFTSLKHPRLSMISPGI